MTPTSIKSVNAKCKFIMDGDGWMGISDGQSYVTISPDEVQALKKFLDENTQPSPQADIPKDRINDSDVVYIREDVVNTDTERIIFAGVEYSHEIENLKNEIKILKAAIRLVQ